MFEKERARWNSIKTVRDYFNFIEDPTLEVHTFMFENCDLSKSGWWIVGNIKFDIDIDAILEQQPLKDQKATEVSKVTRLPSEEIHHEKFGYTNGYDRHIAKGKMTKIVEALGFEANYQAVINNQPPAGVLHRHTDIISSYMYEGGKIINPDQEYDIELRQPKGARPIWRCFVALDDWHPGQLVYFEPKLWTHWKKGDVMFFDWRNTPHSSANTGLEQRPLLKITGYLKDDSYVINSRESGTKTQWIIDDK